MTYQEQSITALVEQLPEVYQPIFKHSEFSAQASRSCLDRLEVIASIYDYISKEKGRPLKVLDLGCAQGFFSLSLAERGAIVTAVDYSQPNVDVCNKLLEEHSGFNVEFLLDSIETVIQDTIEEKEYDLVLGLSVFHHLIYEHDAEYVFELFKILSKKVESGIFEFALNSEPLYWAESQPENPRNLIDSYTFSHHLSMYGTHLSTVERPLFFSSNKYWSIEGMYGVINHYMQRSHQFDDFYHDNHRRYYFSDDKIIKIFLENKSETNHSELLNESVFLNREIPGFRVSKLLSYGSNISESWLVRTKIPGRLLLDIILSGDEYDDKKIISGVLEQITILEKNGFYHNDLRPWNILIGDDDQVYLIDYGSICTFVTDGDDLYGLMLSFFVLIKEIGLHRIREQGSQRPRFVSPYDFPEKYRNWITKVWSMPSQQWNFESISSVYHEQGDVPSEVPVEAILESYLSTATNHVNWQIKQLQNSVVSRIDSLTNDIRTEHQAVVDEFRNKDIEYLTALEPLLSKSEQETHAPFQDKNKQLIAENNKRLAERVDSAEADQPSLQALIEENKNLKSEIHVKGKALEDIRNELNLVYASRSWMVTYPIRILSKSVKLVFHPGRVLSGVKSLIKKKSSKLISGLVMFVSNRPVLKQRVIRLLNRYPGLKYKIKRNIPRQYENTPPIPVINNVIESEHYCEKSEHEQVCVVKKTGVHEEQKSVLESWFY